MSEYAFKADAVQTFEVWHDARLDDAKAIYALEQKTKALAAEWQALIDGDYMFKGCQCPVADADDYIDELYGRLGTHDGEDRRDWRADVEDDRRARAQWERRRAARAAMADAMFAVIETVEYGLSTKVGTWSADDAARVLAAIASKVHAAEREAAEGVQ